MEFFLSTDIIIFMQSGTLKNNAYLRNRKIQNIKGSLSKIPIISKNSLKISSKIKSDLQQDKSSSATKNSQTADNSTPIHFLDIKETSLFQERYEILEKIGQGANGFVNKCRKVRSGKIYAVKSLMMDQEHIMELKENFLAIRSLDHLNIVKYKALYIDMRKKLCYIVMEYVNLPSLQTIKFSKVQELKNVIYQLLESCKYLHQKNISHRDLKPENVLYDAETMKIKIIDFGTSKNFLRRNTKVDMLTITGTVFYRAPEMFTGGGYDQKVDIWAIGILLYKMISGRTPFESGYLSDAINKIKDQNPSFQQPLWQTTQNKLKNLIKRMLKKDKNERLSASECLRDVWFYSLTFAKLSDLTQTYQKFIHGVKNAQYGKKIVRVSICPEQQQQTLSHIIKKVEGEDYHSIDSEVEDGPTFKSAGDLNMYGKMRRKLATSLAW